VNELWLVDETLRHVEVRNQSGSDFGEGLTFTKQETIVSRILPDIGFAVTLLRRKAW